MNSEYHDQVSQPIIFKRGTTSLAARRMRRGFAVAIVMLIAGCSGGDGGSQNPPQTAPPPAPPPAPAPAPHPLRRPLHRRLRRPLRRRLRRPLRRPPAARSAPAAAPPPPNPSGLDARPSNTTCIAPARATGSATIGTQRVFPNLRFQNQPISLQQVPGDSSRWFVVERLGTVRVFDNNEAVTATSDFINIASRVETTCAECGLLGMAFHPDFPATPRVYLSYTSLERQNDGPDSRLSEFTSRDGGLTLDPDSERNILTIRKESRPSPRGRIAFGPDGFLYVSMGDGNSYEERQRPALDDAAREDHSHRHPRHNRHGALSDPGRQSVRREHHALQRERLRHAELSRDLRLGLSQSLGLELRSPDR